ncbi:MAG: hypothetical protein FWF68_05235, partial [Spirochaetes bacterium]|nr:hypothetical protein [Spirochaetota bacterium]
RRQGKPHLMPSSLTKQNESAQSTSPPHGRTNEPTSVSGQKYRTQSYRKINPQLYDKKQQQSSGVSANPLRRSNGVAFIYGGFGLAFIESTPTPP